MSQETQTENDLLMQDLRRQAADSLPTVPNSLITKLLSPEDTLTFDPKESGLEIALTEGALYQIYEEDELAQIAYADTVRIVEETETKLSEVDDQITILRNLESRGMNVNVLIQKLETQKQQIIQEAAEFFEEKIPVVLVVEPKPAVADADAKDVENAKPARRKKVQKEESLNPFLNLLSGDEEELLRAVIPLDEDGFPKEPIPFNHRARTRELKLKSVNLAITRPRLNQKLREFGADFEIQIEGKSFYIIAQVPHPIEVVKKEVYEELDILKLTRDDNFLIQTLLDTKGHPIRIASLQKLGCSNLNLRDLAVKMEQLAKQFKSIRIIREGESTREFSYRLELTEVEYEKDPAPKKQPLEVNYVKEAGNQAVKIILADGTSCEIPQDLTKFLIEIQRLKGGSKIQIGENTIVIAISVQDLIDLDGSLATSAIKSDQVTKFKQALHNFQLGIRINPALEQCITLQIPPDARIRTEIFKIAIKNATLQFNILEHSQEKPKNDVTAVVAEVLTEVLTGQNKFDAISFLLSLKKKGVAVNNTLGQRDLETIAKALVEVIFTPRQATQEAITHISIPKWNSDKEIWEIAQTKAHDVIGGHALKMTGSMRLTTSNVTNGGNNMFILSQALEKTLKATHGVKAINPKYIDTFIEVFNAELIKMTRNGEIEKIRTPKK